ncbi:TonB-dependent receptor, partial [Escherichia coli]|uniref:TonB-dependent receptor plug domain-containing protein n=1 Tax=Escherichia coli TaxID=562 RepID=UPI0019349A2E
IRGIGTQALSVTTDPAVAISFNSMPMVRNRLFEQEYFDVQRVEVLRGPQGTLYGSGAIGGVIRLTSNPASVTETSASMIGGATATDHGEPGFDMAGIVNVPVMRE